MLILLVVAKSMVRIKNKYGSESIFESQTENFYGVLIEISERQYVVYPLA